MGDLAGEGNNPPKLHAMEQFHKILQVSGIFEKIHFLHGTEIDNNPQVTNIDSIHAKWYVYNHLVGDCNMAMQMLLDKHYQEENLLHAHECE